MLVMSCDIVTSCDVRRFDILHQLVSAQDLDISALHQ